MINIWCYNFKNKELIKIQSGNNYPSADAFITSFPIGVYTTIRTVEKTKIFQLEFHLSRLRESLQLMNVRFDYSLNEIRKPLYKLVTDFPSDEVKVRLFIPISDIDKCYLLLESLDHPTRNLKLNGVEVNTNHLNRINPKAKMTAFIKKSEELKRFCKENNLEDSIMLNSNNDLLEGLSSNFFAVISDVLYTDDNEVLNGATREIILLEAEKEHIQINYQAINYSNLKNVDEAFITSTSRGVLPVIKIDDQIIGNGKPGKITRILMEKLDSRMKEEAEDIIYSSASSS